MLQQSMHAANSFLLIHSDNTRHTPWTCLHDHVLLLMPIQKSFQHMVRRTTSKSINKCFYLSNTLQYDRQGYSSNEPIRLKSEVLGKVTINYHIKQ